MVVVVLKDWVANGVLAGGILSLTGQQGGELKLNFLIPLFL